jgi:hypothetical protein
MKRLQPVFSGSLSVLNLTKVTMKKMIIIFMFCFVCSVLMPQDIKWDYPVKPGSNEWAQLTTQEMKIKACQIPIEILQQISTQDLINLYLNYPLLININVFSTFQKGMDDLSKNFNGINELYRREGSAKLLMDGFIKISPKNFDPNWPPIQGFKYVLDLVALELLLSQKEILGQLTNDELNLLLINSVQKYKEKKELIKIYDQTGLSTVSILITSLILKIDPTGLLFPLQEINQLYMKANLNSPGALNYLPELDRITIDVTRLIK